MRDRDREGHRKDEKGGCDEMKNAETFLRAGGQLVITGNEDAPGPKPGQASQVSLTLQPPVIHREKPGHTRHGHQSSHRLCSVCGPLCGQFRGTGVVLNSGAVWSQEEAPPPLIEAFDGLRMPEWHCEVALGGLPKIGTAVGQNEGNVSPPRSVVMCSDNSVPRPPCGTA